MAEKTEARVLEHQLGRELRETEGGEAESNVIAYCRVSTAEQADGGVSLQAQRRRLRAYSEAHGLHVLHVEEDAGISAKRTANRPALQRALATLKEGRADGLVVVKLDRLSRTTRDVLDLVERAEREGWALHSIEERLDTASPHGRFVVTILAALAQMEREQIGARTKAAMAELRRQGRKISSKPRFGFRFDGDRVVAEPAEEPILHRMLELQDEGAGCFRIATVLNEEGTPNPRTGQPWYYGTVRTILENATGAAAAQHR